MWLASKIGVLGRYRDEVDALHDSGMKKKMKVKIASAEVILEYNGATTVEPGLIIITACNTLFTSFDSINF